MGCYRYRYRSSNGGLTVHQRTPSQPPTKTLAGEVVTIYTTRCISRSSSLPPLLSRRIRYISRSPLSVLSCPVLSRQSKHIETHSPGTATELLLISYCYYTSSIASTLRIALLMPPPENHDYIPDGEHIEVDTSPDLDWDVCSVNSAANSIFEYRFENGRRYHAYRDGVYAFPNDEKEQFRLDMLHHVCLLVLKGDLHTSPLCQNPSKILDVGTGTGIWAIDMGEQYPSAEVTGIDLSPIQPSWVPPNVSFLIDDAESEWEWAEGTFDMIHIRYLNGAISDWNALFAAAYKCLKPGGWIEVCEYDMDLDSDDGTYRKDSNLRKYYELTNEAAKRAGRHFIGVDTLINGTERAGFRNSTLKRIKVPLGKWPADPLQREIGEGFLKAAETGFEALGMALLTRNLGMHPNDVTNLINSAKQELWTKKMHVYNVHYFLHAQKPLTI